MADKQKEGAIGIVLSGNASDGALGLKAIKMAGGITFAQDESAKFHGMPRSAVAEGGVDLVMSPKQIAEELHRLSEKTSVLQQVMKGGDESIPITEKEEDVRYILDLLKRSVGVDFTYYKKNTITRRIVRRMLIHRLETLKDYSQYLRQHTAEINLLYQDLLINVTNFFRDPDTSDYLSKILLPEIIKSKASSHPLRIWVPACSSGEEAYSLAILIMETLGERAANTSVQIFATDISESALTRARMGIYKKEELENVSPERLEKYFTKTDSTYRIVKIIRDWVVFAPHNIFKDPPFTRLDMISCCNLFIYLDSALQQKILSIFHYALNSNGYLVLGRSENTTASQSLFKLLEKGVRAYQRNSDNSDNNRLELSYRISSSAADKQNTAARSLERPVLKDMPHKEAATDIEKTVDRMLLSAFVPACVVVNTEFEIVQFRGNTSTFLQNPPGKATLNLLKMVKPGIGFEVRNAIYKVKKTKQPFHKTGLLVKNKGLDMHASIEVLPLENGEAGNFFLVIFRETEQSHESKIKGKGNEIRIKDLELELVTAREDMRAIIEGQEAMNEELQSANEEIVSSNEELQSINEELETSKEEVESTNEELMTINQELQVRNDQLSEAYEYADSIFSTIRESLIVLDKDLRIRNANKTFYQTFLVNEQETEGAYIYDLGNGQWNIPELRKLLEEILPFKQILTDYEVRHDFEKIGKKIMLLNARKIKQKIHGIDLILLAMEDITVHVQAQELIKEQGEMFRNMADNAPVMIWTSDTEGNRNFFNKTWLEFTGKTLEEETGMGWLRDVNPVDREEFMKIYMDATQKRISYKAEYRLIRSDNTYRWMLSSAKPFFDAQNNFTGFIGTVIEIHDQRIINQELEERVQRRTADLEKAKSNLERSNTELRQFSYVASHDLQEPLRKIQSFATYLLQKENQNLSENGKDYFRRMQNAASNMQKLIVDLLAYSRTNTVEGKFETVHLANIIKEVEANLREELTEKNAVLDISTLCETNVIPFQFRQLLYNLISNSLKFRNTQIQPHIIIKSEIVRGLQINNGKLPLHNEYCHISVSDNGIGFDPKYSEQIFEVFQRLHGRSEYEGTGIGLAIVKKIVENHHGMITATGKPGKGATFDIYIPA